MCRVRRLFAARRPVVQVMVLHSVLTLAAFSSGSGQAAGKDRATEAPESSKTVFAPTTDTAIHVDWPRKVRNRAFSEGEKLTYSVRYLGIRAGICSLEIPRIKEMGHAQAFRLVALSRTNSFFDKFYKVRSRFESLIDTEGLFSWGYLEDQNENGVIRKRVSDYDHIAGVARVTSYPVQKRKKRKENQSPKIETATLPPACQDVLSALYYLRTQDLQVGQVYRLPTISGIKSYELIVRVVREARVKTPLGRFQTLELLPEVKYDGLFVNKGKLHVFVTNDEYKVPVLLKSKVAVGSFKAVLIEKRLGQMLAVSKP